jgi:hypothetical protein
MSLTLNNIRSGILHHRFFLVAGLLVIILFSVIVLQQTIRISRPTYTPPPASQQPVVNGKLDISAQAVKESKNFLDIIKPKLPYDQTPTTSTGTKVSYTVFAKTPDLYTLYVAIIGVDFTIPKDDPKFAQTVQNFRDTADSLYSFLTSNGVNPSAIYIVWADNLLNQKTAESWLNVSVDFPKVVKQNGKYIFENSK